MAITRKHLIRFFSITCLILITALSGYATSCSVQLSLPIPRGLAYSTTALPVFSTLLIELGFISVWRLERQQKRVKENSPQYSLTILLEIVLSLYSTSVATQLGPHVTPSSERDCGLRERWSSFFQQKSETIRTIQDVFQCCGFKNLKDMAWPFPDKSHPISACETDFGRTQGCLDGWKDEERRVASILMAVVGLAFVWQLRQFIPRRILRVIEDETDSDADVSRRRIGYTAVDDRYSDETEEHNDIERTMDEETCQAELAPNTRAYHGGQERLLRTRV